MPAREIINSGSVRVFEGSAKDLLPRAKLPSDMHGFAVLVPAGAAHEWKLDLLWRIAFLYAFDPSPLKSRSKVTKIIEAVVRADRRPDKACKNTGDLADKPLKRHRKELPKHANSKPMR